jgi:two-component system, OmpR family, response regulator
MVLPSNKRSSETSVSGRILFVDDNEDTCEMIKLVLAQVGYEVAVGRSAMDALRLARANRFDLILLDMYFHDGNGLDLCRKVREFDDQTPIFFYTGMSQDQLVSEAIKAGAQGYFVKPVEIDTLLQTLAAQISPPDKDRNQ